MWPLSVFVVSRTDGTFAPERIWNRSVGGSSRLRTVADVRALVAFSEPSAPVDQFPLIQYNDRYGNLINVVTDQDVGNMIREWELCHNTFERIKHKAFLPPPVHGMTPTFRKPALDVLVGLRAELHVTWSETVTGQEVSMTPSALNSTLVESPALEEALEFLRRSVSGQM